jgi:hypothetical protein
LARGGIVGTTEHSAVGAGHRAWFKVTCAYTTGFAALAAIEELKLQAQAEHSPDRPRPFNRFTPPDRGLLKDITGTALSSAGDYSTFL